MHFVIILSVLYDDNFILAADRIHDRIIQVDLESGNLVKIPVKVVGVTGVAYEKSTGTIFYTTSKDLFSARVGSISLRGDRDPVTYATGNTWSRLLWTNIRVVRYVICTVWCLKSIRLKYWNEFYIPSKHSSRFKIHSNLFLKWVTVRWFRCNSEALTDGWATGLSERRPGLRSRFNLNMYISAWN